MNADVDEPCSDLAGTARKWSASSKVSHLWISPIVLVRILGWIFKEPCFLKLVWEARKPELAAEARLVWLWHVERIRHCGDARISEAREYRRTEWIPSYTLSAVPCSSTEKNMQIPGLRARDQTTTNGSASQCRGEEMKKNEVFLKLWGLGKRRWTVCLPQCC